MDLKVQVNGKEITMPYIKKEKRKEILDPAIEYDHIRMHEITNAGELNYAISSLLWNYYNNISVQGAQSYQSINDVLGALEGAKMEFYRRVAIPYEDDKIKTNGDVFDQSQLPPAYEED